MGPLPCRRAAPRSTTRAPRAAAWRPVAGDDRGKPRAGDRGLRGFRTDLDVSHPTWHRFSDRAQRGRDPALPHKRLQLTDALNYERHRRQKAKGTEKEHETGCADQSWPRRLARSQQPTDSQDDAPGERNRTPPKRLRREAMNGGPKTTHDGLADLADEAEHDADAAKHEHATVLEHREILSDVCEAVSELVWAEPGLR
jgi:hypothetical protein